MLKLSGGLKLSVLTLSLMGLTLCCSNIAESAQKEIEYAGTGYLLSELAGRDILEGWLSDRAAKEQYKTALNSMYEEWQQTKLSLEIQISEIHKSHEQEQREWEKKLRGPGMPGFGVFAGPAYTGGQDVQMVVGFGLVWKLF